MNTTVEQPMIRLGDVIRSEVTKITTHPATFLMLIITVAANLVFAGIDASGVTFYTGDPAGPSSLSDFGVVMIAPLYVFLVIPVWAAATEHLGVQIRMSLTATQHRAAFVFAKVVAIFTALIPASVIAVVPARLVIGIAGGLRAADLFKASCLWVGAYVFMSVIAFGFAGVLKNTVAPLGIMIALPVVIATGVLQWSDGLRFLPDQAALSLVGTRQFDVHEIAPGLAAVVLAIWSVIAVAAYEVAVTRRDA